MFSRSILKTFSSSASTFILSPPPPTITEVIASTLAKNSPFKFAPSATKRGPYPEKRVSSFMGYNLQINGRSGQKQNAFDFSREVHYMGVKSNKLGFAFFLNPFVSAAWRDGRKWEMRWESEFLFAIPFAWKNQEYKSGNLTWIRYFIGATSLEAERFLHRLLQLCVKVQKGIKSWNERI